MLALNLPTFEVKMKEDGTKKMIFDVIRRKYVALTPEEWVRQHFTAYLTVSYISDNLLFLSNQDNIWS